MRHWGDGSPTLLVRRAPTATEIKTARRRDASLLRREINLAVAARDKLASERERVRRRWRGVMTELLYWHAVRRLLQARWRAMLRHLCRHKLLRGRRLSLDEEAERLNERVVARLASLRLDAEQRARRVREDRERELYALLYSDLNAENRRLRHDFAKMNNLLGRQPLALVTRRRGGGPPLFSLARGISVEFDDFCDRVLPLQLHEFECRRRAELGLNAPLHRPTTMIE